MQKLIRKNIQDIVHSEKNQSKVYKCGFIMLPFVLKIGKVRVFTFV